MITNTIYTNPITTNEFPKIDSSFYKNYNVQGSIDITSNSNNYINISNYSKDYDLISTIHDIDYDKMKRSRYTYEGTTEIPGGFVAIVQSKDNENECMYMYCLWNKKPNAYYIDKNNGVHSVKIETESIEICGKNIKKAILIASINLISIVIDGSVDVGYTTNNNIMIGTPTSLTVSTT